MACRGASVADEWPRSGPQSRGTGGCRRCCRPSCLSPAGHGSGPNPDSPGPSAHMCSVRWLLLQDAIANTSSTAQGASHATSSILARLASCCLEVPSAAMHPACQTIALLSAYLPAADRLHRACLCTGEWLCLKNLHLVLAWLPVLERALRSLKSNANFRLVLTSEPHPAFPAALLEACLKVLPSRCTHLLPHHGCLLVRLGTCQCCGQLSSTLCFHAPHTLARRHCTPDRQSSTG